MPPQRSSLISLRKPNRSPPDPQLHSLLFTKLPTHLLYDILKLAVGCPIIAIGIWDRPDGRSGLKVYPWGEGSVVEDQVRSARLLSLALTCRLAYQEVLPLLYGINTFGVSQQAAVSLLVTRPSVRPLIRRLDVSMTLSRAPKQVEDGWRRVLTLGGGSRRDREWAKMWQGMAKIEDLRWLRIELTVPWTWTYGWKAREQEILAPLVQLSRDGTWRELILYWPRHHGLDVAAEEMFQGWSLQRKCSIAIEPPPYE